MDHAFAGSTNHHGQAEQHVEALEAEASTLQRWGATKPPNGACEDGLPRAIRPCGARGRGIGQAADRL